MKENVLKSSKSKNYKFWMVLAICLCVVLGGVFLINSLTTSKPNPEYVQVVNPILKVASAEEMSEYLDFKVPVLKKEVTDYIVLVIDGYPQSGRILYADGGCFNMMYGTGDISGIYGGILEKEETVNNIKISYYNYNDTKYALWETEGFTYSLAGGEGLQKAVDYLTK